MAALSATGFGFSSSNAKSIISINSKTNLVFNPSFETNILGWDNPTTGTTGATRDTTTAYSGSASAKIAYLGSATFGIGSYNINVIPGQTYTFGFWAKRSADVGQYNANVMWYNAAGSLVQDGLHLNVPSTTSNTTFKSFSQTVTAPAGAVFANLRIYQTSGESGGATAVNIWIDSVSFIQGSSPITDIFSGDFSLYINSKSNGNSLLSINSNLSKIQASVASQGYFDPKVYSINNSSLIANVLTQSGANEKISLIQAINQSNQIDYNFIQDSFEGLNGNWSGIINNISYTNSYSYDGSQSLLITDLYPLGGEIVDGPLGARKDFNATKGRYYKLTAYVQNVSSTTPRNMYIQIAWADNTISRGVVTPVSLNDGWVKLELTALAPAYGNSTIYIVTTDPFTLIQNDLAVIDYVTLLSSSLPNTKYNNSITTSAGKERFSLNSQVSGYINTYSDTNITSIMQEPIRQSINVISQGYVDPTISSILSNNLILNLNSTSGSNSKILISNVLSPYLTSYSNSNSIFALNNKISPLNITTASGTAIYFTIFVNNTKASAKSNAYVDPTLSSIMSDNLTLNIYSNTLGFIKPSIILSPILNASSNTNGLEKFDLVSTIQSLDITNLGKLNINTESNSYSNISLNSVINKTYLQAKSNGYSDPTISSILSNNLILNAYSNTLNLINTSLILNPILNALSITNGREKFDLVATIQPPDITNLGKLNINTESNSYLNISLNSVINKTYLQAESLGSIQPIFNTLISSSILTKSSGYIDPLITSVLTDSLILNIIALSSGREKFGTSYLLSQTTQSASNSFEKFAIKSNIQLIINAESDANSIISNIINIKSLASINSLGYVDPLISTISTNNISLSGFNKSGGNEKLSLIITQPTPVSSDPTTGQIPINGSLEIDASSWMGITNPVSQTNLLSYDGINSLLIQEIDSINVSDGIGLVGARYTFNVSKNTTYNFSAYVNNVSGTSPRQMYAMIQWQDNSMSISPVKNVSVTDGWTNLSVTGTAPITGGAEIFVVTTTPFNSINGDIAALDGAVLTYSFIPTNNIILNVKSNGSLNISLKSILSQSLQANTDSDILLGINNKLRLSAIGQSDLFFDLSTAFNKIWDLNYPSLNSVSNGYIKTLMPTQLEPLLAESISSSIEKFAIRSPLTISINTTSILSLSISNNIGLKNSAGAKTFGYLDPAIFTTDTLPIFANIYTLSNAYIKTGLIPATITLASYSNSNAFELFKFNSILKANVNTISDGDSVITNNIGIKSSVSRKSSGYNDIFIFTLDPLTISGSAIAKTNSYIKTNLISSTLSSIASAESNTFELFKFNSILKEKIIASSTGYADPTLSSIFNSALSIKAYSLVYGTAFADITKAPLEPQAASGASGGREKLSLITPITTSSFTVANNIYSVIDLNGSMEYGTDGWSGITNPVSQSSLISYDGAYSLLIQDPDGLNVSDGLGLQGARHDFVAVQGATYRLSAQVANIVGETRSMYAFIKWADGSSSSKSTSFVSTAGGWSSLEISAYSPVNGLATIYIVTSDPFNSINGDISAIDAVSLTYTIPSAYIPTGYTTSYGKISESATIKISQKANAISYSNIPVSLSFNNSIKASVSRKSSGYVDPIVASIATFSPIISIFAVSNGYIKTGLNSASISLIANTQSNAFEKFNFQTNIKSIINTVSDADSVISNVIGVKSAILAKTSGYSDPTILILDPLATSASLIAQSNAYIKTSLIPATLTLISATESNAAEKLVTQYILKEKIGSISNGYADPTLSSIFNVNIVSSISTKSFGSIITGFISDSISLNMISFSGGKEKLSLVIPITLSNTVSLDTIINTVPLKGALESKYSQSFANINISLVNKISASLNSNTFTTVIDPLPTISNLPLQFVTKSYGFIDPTVVNIGTFNVSTNGLATSNGYIKTSLIPATLTLNAVIESNAKEFANFKSNIIQSINTISDADSIIINNIGIKSAASTRSSGYSDPTILILDPVATSATLIALSSGYIKTNLVPATLTLISSASSNAKEFANFKTNIKQSINTVSNADSIIVNNLGIKASVSTRSSGYSDPTILILDALSTSATLIASSNAYIKTNLVPATLTLISIAESNAKEFVNFQTNIRQSIGTYSNTNSVITNNIGIKSAASISSLGYANPTIFTFDALNINLFAAAKSNGSSTIRLINTIVPETPVLFPGNLIQNSSFDLDTQYWLPIINSISTTNSYAYNGLNSLLVSKLDPIGGEETNGPLGIRQDFNAVVQNSYTLSAYVRNISSLDSRNMYVQIVWNDGTYSRSLVKPISSSDGWVNLSVQAVAPVSGLATVYVVTTEQFTLTESDLAVIDSVSLSVASVPSYRFNNVVGNAAGNISISVNSKIVTQLQSNVNGYNGISFVSKLLIPAFAETSGYIISQSPISITPALFATTNGYIKTSIIPASIQLIGNAISDAFILPTLKSTINQSINSISDADNLLSIVSPIKLSAGIISNGYISPITSVIIPGSLRLTAVASSGGKEYLDLVETLVVTSGNINAIAETFGQIKLSNIFAISQSINSESNSNSIIKSSYTISPLSAGSTITGFIDSTINLLSTNALRSVAGYSRTSGQIGFLSIASGNAYASSNTKEKASFVSQLALSASAETGSSVTFVGASTSTTSLRISINSTSNGTINLDPVSITLPSFIAIAKSGGQLWPTVLAQGTLISLSNAQIKYNIISTVSQSILASSNLAISTIGKFAISGTAQANSGAIFATQPQPAIIEVISISGVGTSNGYVTSKTSFVISQSVITKSNAKINTSSLSTFKSQTLISGTASTNGKIVEAMDGKLGDFIGWGMPI
jgi:hypothetical protein